MPISWVPLQSTALPTELSKVDNKWKVEYLIASTSRVATLWRRYEARVQILLTPHTAGDASVEQHLPCDDAESASMRNPLVMASATKTPIIFLSTMYM